MIYSWPNLVQGNPKAPFSIATTLGSRGGCYYLPEIAPLNLDLYLIMLSAKQGGIKYHFLSLWHDLTWNLILVFQAIGEPSNHYANGLV